MRQNSSYAEELDLGRREAGLDPANRCALRIFLRLEVLQANDGFGFLWLFG